MRWILQTAVMLSLGSTSVPAQTGAASTEWVPTLVVRGIQALPESAQVIGERKLAKGEPLAVTIWTGSSLCQVGIGEPEPPAPVRQNIWKMTGDYLGERDGRHQVRLTSGFTRLSGADAGGTTTQTLSLREGDSVVLDSLSAPVNGSCAVHVVTLEARLVLQAVSPALARTRYAADLWLVHRDPLGHEQREHLVSNVSAGDPAVPFTFSPLAFPIPMVDSRQGNAAAEIRLSGSLRVRPRANGDVAIDLDVNRPLFVLDNPDKPAVPSMPPTHMTLTVNNEETAAVDFPPPSSGYSAMALGTNPGRATRMAAGPQTRTSSTQPIDAVQAKDDKLILYTFQFFKGHSTRLLITLKRLP